MLKDTKDHRGIRVTPGLPALRVLRVRPFRVLRGIRVLKDQPAVPALRGRREPPCKAHRVYRGQLVLLVVKDLRGIPGRRELLAILGQLALRVTKAIKGTKEHRAYRAQPRQCRDRRATKVLRDSLVRVPYRA